jgi:hypothetical protein
MIVAKPQVPQSLGSAACPRIVIKGSARIEPRASDATEIDDEVSHAV